MKSYQASIITIGSELLTGRTLDTNGRFLAHELHELGFSVKRKISIPDEEAAILSALEKCWEDSDLVLLSGGLGPTPDDITKKVLSRVFDMPLRLDSQEFKRLQKLYPRQAKIVPQFVRLQASYPAGAELLRNPVGAAQGLLFQKGEKCCIAIPGVPVEAEAMFLESVAPRLRKLFKQLKSFQGMVFKTVGQSESFLLKKIGKTVLSREGIDLGIYPEIGEVTLRIRNRALKQNQFTGLRNVIRKKINPWLYGEEEISLSEALVKRLECKKQTLALAESSTGGWISKKITDIPGASKVFKGAFVVYSNESKTGILGLSQELLRKWGAVSDEAAQAMASSIRKTLNSTYGLSVTGIAGPAGASREKPVGLTYIGLATPQKTTVEKFIFKGDRFLIRRRAVQKALHMLKDALWGTRTARGLLSSS